MTALARPLGGPYESIERFCVTNRGTEPVTLRLRLADVADPRGMAPHLRWRLETADGARATLVADARLEDLTAGTSLTEADGEAGATRIAGGGTRCFELAARLMPDAPNAVQGAMFSYRLNVTALPWAMRGQ